MSDLEETWKYALQVRAQMEQAMGIPKNSNAEPIAGYFLPIYYPLFEEFEKEANKLLWQEYLKLKESSKK